MSANINFNPLITTNAAGSFQIESAGYVQGVAMDDPAARYQLAGGILAASETLPMWGGVGISELVPSNGPTNPSPTLGTIVSRASTLTAAANGQLTGFSVFNQNHSMINFPQSPVPLANNGMTVMFYRLGSNIRLAVALNPALISLEGGLITQQVSWDFTNQQLTQGQAAFGANVLTDAVWANTNGGQATFTTTSNHGIQVGSNFTISGCTPAGYNGDYVAITGTTGETLVAALLTNPGNISVEGTLVAGGGYLPCKILDINAGNSMTVSYSSATGFATWNRGGYAALIQI